jgi:hypothetical protein
MIAAALALLTSWEYGREQKPSRSLTSLKVRGFPSTSLRAGGMTRAPVNRDVNGAACFS